jgi:hypothetical protein
MIFGIVIKFLDFGFGEYYVILMNFLVEIGIFIFWVRVLHCLFLG